MELVKSLVVGEWALERVGVSRVEKLRKLILEIFGCFFIWNMVGSRVCRYSLRNFIF